MQLSLSNYSEMQIQEGKGGKSNMEWHFAYSKVNLCGFHQPFFIVLRHAKECPF